MSNKNYDDINIPADLDLVIENGALKAKNEIRKKRNKKYSIIAASIVGVITLGIISQPVLAEQIPALGKIYEAMGFKSVEKSLYIGQSITENGVKITLENIACSKNRALIAYRIEANKDLIDEYKGYLPIIIAPVKGDFIGENLGEKSQQISEKEILYVSSLAIEDNFERNRELKINVYSYELGINNTINIKMNLNNLISDTVELELKKNNWKEGDSISVLQSSALGSLLITGDIKTEKWSNELFKVGNKIYTVAGMSSDNDKTSFNISRLYADKLKGIDSIMLLNDNFYMLDIQRVNINETGLSDEQIQVKIKEQCEINRKEKESIEKSYINGISYPKELIFENGNKAEILNCEKIDGKIYFDVKGTRDSEAWALANAIYVTDINNKYNTQLRPNYFEIIDGGYRVEFDDILEGDVKLVIDPFTEKYYDRKITEELKLNIK